MVYLISVKCRLRLKPSVMWFPTLLVCSAVRWCQRAAAAMTAVLLLLLKEKSQGCTLLGLGAFPNDGTWVLQDPLRFGKLSCKGLGFSRRKFTRVKIRLYSAVCVAGGNIHFPQCLWRDPPIMLFVLMPTKWVHIINKVDFWKCSQHLIRVETISICQSVRHGYTQFQASVLIGRVGSDMHQSCSGLNWSHLWLHESWKCQFNSSEPLWSGGNNKERKTPNRNTTVKSQKCVCQREWGVTCLWTKKWPMFNHWNKQENFCQDVKATLVASENHASNAISHFCSVLLTFQIHSWHKVNIDKARLFVRLLMCTRPMCATVVVEMCSYSL